MRKQLSESDSAILTEVQKYGVRTFKELRENVLSEYDRAYAWRKMRKLVEVGLLNVIQDPSGAIAGWRMVSSNRTVDRYPEKSAKIINHKAYKYQTNFAHDLEVRWTCDQMEKVPMVTKIETESKLRSDVFSDIRGSSRREMNQLLSKIPDARITLKKGEHTYYVALEMELTQKSSDRLYEKLEHYIAKSGYDLVLYVCGTESIYNSIKRNYSRVIANSAAVKFANEKAGIYVCMLYDLKSDFMHAVFKSHHDEFSISQL